MSQSETITCFACNNEAVALYSKGVGDKPVCEIHVQELREIGAW